MSMISSLIDELRKSADGQVTYRDARAVMLEAADTIWQLRDDLQRANEAVRDAEHDESRAWDRVRKAEAESAKLRELVAVMPRCWNADCEGCPMAAGKTVYGYGAERCIAEDKLRELGVEVDDG